MPKKRVSVQIEGRNYTLITPDDEKYVREVAKEVVRCIRKAAQNSKQLDTRDCAVLAALDFCDDRNKAMKKNSDIVQKADKIIRQTNDLNKLCAEYKEKLAEAINENTKLVKRVKELEEKLESASGQNGGSNRTQSNAQKAPEKTEEEIRNEKLLNCVPMKQVSLFDDDGEKNEKN